VSPTVITTSYGGFTILVDNECFVVLGRNGEPVETEKKLTTMSATRALIRELRRAEREAA
jgi:hypothetical protein